MQICASALFRIKKMDKTEYSKFNTGKFVHCILFAIFVAIKYESMKNCVEKFAKNLCKKLQFLQLYEAFLLFLQPAQNPYNALIYNNLVGGGKFLFKKKFAKIYTQNLFFKCKNNWFYVQ
jgi:hypothetical protein